VTVRESVEMGVQGTSVIVHFAEVWKEQPRRGVTFEEANLHAMANVLHAASVWGIRRLIFVSIGGSRPGDPDPYFDARGRAEALVRGSDRSWTVFRLALRSVRGCVHGPVPVGGTLARELPPVFLSLLYESTGSDQAVPP